LDDDLKPVGQDPIFTMATLPELDLQLEPDDLNPAGHEPSRATSEELDCASATGAVPMQSAAAAIVVMMVFIFLSLENSAGGLARRN
jgi:hypothetical protein